MCETEKSPVNMARLALYKNNGRDWKEAYRKRCLDRLRERRSELYSKRRRVEEGEIEETDDSERERTGEDFVKIVMNSELKALRDENWVDCEMEFVDPTTGEIDMTLALIEEIQEEMKAEEAKLIAEYEIYQSSLEQEEAALCQAIGLLHTGPVCPVCTKSPLMENKGVIFCKCGLRIFTGQDSVGLDFVQSQLDMGVEQHSGQCEGQPVFTVQHIMDITTLTMSCQKCPFLYIIV